LSLRAYFYHWIGADKGRGLAERLRSITARFKVHEILVTLGVLETALCGPKGSTLLLDSLVIVPVSSVLVLRFPGEG
jgi:hypothetical protein